MWAAAGVERSGDRLAAALESLDDPPAGGAISGVADGAGAAEPTAAVERLETANLRDVARLVLTAALAREESRGAHVRRDFPATDPARARSTSWTRKVHEHADR
jgi:L-aspartate oxidase